MTVTGCSSAVERFGSSPYYTGSTENQREILSGTPRQPTYQDIARGPGDRGRIASIFLSAVDDRVNPQSKLDDRVGAITCAKRFIRQFTASAGNFNGCDLAGTRSEPGSGCCEREKLEGLDVCRRDEGTGSPG
ncbi:hypothetical protein QW131_08735 [Roseibium salinum]|nr:hypothetical protein [Roseibium salinum]